MESSTTTAAHPNETEPTKVAREAREADERHLKSAPDEKAQPDGAVAHTGGFEPDAEGEGDGADEPDLINLEVQGDGQLTLTVGGAKPEVSTVRLIGGKMDVSDGDFDKGQDIKFLIHGVVSSVEFIDSRDQYGNLSGTERRHKIRPLRVERLRD